MAKFVKYIVAVYKCPYSDACMIIMCSIKSLNVSIAEGLISGYRIQSKALIYPDVLL